MSCVVLMPFQRNHELYILSAKFFGEKNFASPARVGETKGFALVGFEFVSRFSAVLGRWHDW